MIFLLTSLAAAWVTLDCPSMVFIVDCVASMNLSKANFACSKLRSANARISAGISKWSELGMIGLLLHSSPRVGFFVSPAAILEKLH
jgi:hypothetical protein